MMLRGEFGGDGGEARSGRSGGSERDGHRAHLAARDDDVVLAQA
jgi:hypothetical protein